MSRAFRQAQSESLAGHHDAAAKLFAQTRKSAPQLAHLALQEALAEAASDYAIASRSSVPLDPAAA